VQFGTFVRQHLPLDWPFFPPAPRFFLACLPHRPAIYLTPQFAFPTVPWFGLLSWIASRLLIQFLCPFKYFPTLGCEFCQRSFFPAPVQMSAILFGLEHSSECRHVQYGAYVFMQGR
jgi:hypothetical protein